MIKIFLSLCIGMFLVLSASTSVYAAADDTAKQQACKGATGGTVSTCSGSTLATNFRKISNLLIFIIGAVAVIMVIIGGFRYVVSGGDSAGVEGAKNTILYALIGIVVAILSYAIVNFVIGSTSTDPGGGGGSDSTPSLNPPTSTPSSDP